MRGTGAVTLRRAASSLSLSAARRHRNRNAWPPAFPDEDFSVFPNEYLGNIYSLNWCISSYNITPTNSAFRNLHARGLAMFAETLDKNKAAVVNANYASNDKIFVVGSSSVGGTAWGDKQFGAIVRAVREHLSEVPALFVHDGSLGLVQGSGPTVRSFTDSASAALLLNNMLRTHALPLAPENGAAFAAWRETLPAELRGDEQRIGELVRRGQLSPPLPPPLHDLTQFVISHWRPTDELRALVGGAESFSVIDPKRRIVLHVGSNANAAAVRNGLVELAYAASPNSTTLVVRAGAALDAASQRSVLVFGNAVGADAPLFAEHHTLWTADDVVTPLWLAGQRKQSAAATKLGDYVEIDGATKAASTVNRWRGPSDAFATGAPAAVVFVAPGPAAPATGKKASAAAAAAAAVPTRINPEQARVLAQQAGLSPAATDSLAARVVKGKIALLTTTDANINAGWLKTILKA